MSTPRLPRHVIRLAEQGHQRSIDVSVAPEGLEREAIAAELEAMVGQVIAAQAEPMPGAHTVVELIAATVPVAVASNSSRSLLDLALCRGGFADAFAVTVARNEAARPKARRVLL